MSQKQPTAQAAAEQGGSERSERIVHKKWKVPLFVMGKPC